MKCRLEIYLLVYDMYTSYHCSSRDESCSYVCSFKGFNMIYETYPIILVESKKNLIILKKVLLFFFQGKSSQICRTAFDILNSFSPAFDLK